MTDVPNIGLEPDLHLIATTAPDAGDALQQLAVSLAQGPGPALASGATAKLLVCESPAAMLARLMLADGQLDPAAALDLWVSSARALMQHAHRYPERSLLLDADEASAAPDQARALWQSLGTSDPTPLPSDAAPGAASHRPDLLAVVAALPLVSAHAEAAAVWAELQSSCRPLPGISPPDASQGLQDWLSEQRLRQQLQDSTNHLEAVLAGAKARAVELEARAVEFESRIAELDARCTQSRDDAELQGLMRRQALEELQLQGERLSAMGAAHDELADCRTRLVDMEGTLVQLRTDLHTAHQGWQTEYGRRLELEQQCASLEAAHGAERSRLQGLAEALQVERDSLRSDCETASAELARLQRPAATEAATVHAEPRRLVGQIHVARGELERYRETSRTKLRTLNSELAGMAQAAQAQEAQWQLRWTEQQQALATALDDAQRLRTRIQDREQQLVLLQAQFRDLQQAFRPAAEPPKVAVADDAWALDAGATLSFMGERPEGPHRELLLKLRLDGRWPAASPNIEFKLVEHEGRPGFVFVADADGRAPLHLWQPEGEEDGRAYQRLIPADHACAGPLARLPPHDWRLLNGIVLLLGSDLSRRRDTLAERWSFVIKRLAVQMRSLPPRLRYSAVMGEWIDAASAPRRARLRLRDVLYGRDALPDVELLWAPDGGPPCIEWLRPKDGLPPLACWPVDSTGDPAPSLHLAVGAGLDSVGKRRWWAACEDYERELLLALLDTLPGASEVIGSDTSAAPLRAQAAGLQREARQLIGAIGMRMRLHRVRRLLGLGRAAGQ
jgi:hypothetical protein